MRSAPWKFRRLHALAIAIAVPAAVMGWTMWRTSDAKSSAGAEVRTKSEYEFRITPIDAVAPPSVDPIAGAPGFRDLTAYKDNIVVSARGGLFVYDRSGSLIRSYRSGIELPPAELGGLSVGIASGAAEPEVFVTTRGEGLLAFNGSGFRQILPRNSDLRTITCALALGSGRILLGTERRGLLIWDGRSLRPFHAHLQAAHITALAGNDADLWIGTLQNGVFHYRAGELENLETALPDPQVLSLGISGPDAFVGTPLGVVQFGDGRRARTFAHGYFAQALAVAPNRLYVGTEDEGVVEAAFGPRDGVRIAPSADLPSAGGAWKHDPVTRILNLEGSVYAVSGNAIYRYDPSAARWRCSRISAWS